MKYALFTLFYCILSLFATAQTPLLRRLTDEQGLPTPSIYDVIQDRKGFIWLGTDKGLYRYDGIFFQHYDGAALKSSAVTALQEDTEGVIWGINFAGQVWRTSPSKSGNTKLSIEPFRPFESRYKTGIISFKVTADSRLVIASEGNPLYRFGLTTSKIDSFYFDRKVFNNNDLRGTYSLQMDEKGIFYYLEFGIGLVGLLPNDAPFLIHKEEEKNRFRAAQMIRHKGQIFIMGTNQNNTANISEIVNKKLQKPTWLSPKNTLKGIPISIYINQNDHTIWLGTTTGVYHLTPNGQILHHFLAGTTVGNILCDREGMLWFTTPQDGIYCLPSLDMHVLEGNNLVRRLAFDEKNTLFLGTKTGDILSYDLKNNKITQKINVPSNNDWQSFAWLNGSKRAGLYAVRQELWQYLPSENRLNRLNLSATDKDFAENPSDNTSFFAASSFGAFKRDLRKPLALDTSFFSRRFVAVAVNPTDKSVWYASADKLYGIETDGKKLEIPLPFQVIDFVFDADGTAWFATDRAGLVAFKNGQIINNWDAKKGLMGNRILKIVADKTPQYNGHFWLITEGGVQSFDIKTGQFTNFTRANNLLGTSVYDIALTDKDVWIATGGGVQFFPKNYGNIAHSEGKKRVLPLILLEKISVGDQIKDLEKPNLTENDANIQLQFVGLAFISGGRFSYRYRLVGDDSTWTTTLASNPVARFNRLKSGKYTFEVQLVGEDGQVSEVLKYPLSIRPIFWRQTWFYALLALIAVGFVIMYYNRTIKRLREQSQLSERMAAVELDRSRAEEAYRRAQLSALKAQMNPHFLFNALNSIQAYIFLNDKNMANSYLGKFSDLMRTTLEQSQRDYISLVEETRTLELYIALEAMRLQNDLIWTIDFDPSVETEFAMLPPLLIQPYVENALKHGLASKKGNKQVTINFNVNKEQQTLICQIMDNGIGRSAAAELKKQRHGRHTSFSTSATEQRLILLNTGRDAKIYVEFEDLMAENGESAGTSVRIHIPMGS